MKTSSNLRCFLAIWIFQWTNKSFIHKLRNLNVVLVCILYARWPLVYWNSASYGIIITLKISSKLQIAIQVGNKGRILKSILLTSSVQDTWNLILVIWFTLWPLPGCSNNKNPTKSDNVKDSIWQCSYVNNSNQIANLQSRCHPKGHPCQSQNAPIPSPCLLFHLFELSKEPKENNGLLQSILILSLSDKLPPLPEFVWACKISRQLIWNKNVEKAGQEFRKRLYFT